MSNLDTERAEVDLKSNLSLLRVHVKHFNRLANAGAELSEAEKNLVAVYHYDLSRLTKEAREVNNKIKEREKLCTTTQ